MNLWNRFKSLFQRPPPRPDNSGVLLGNQPTDYFVGAANNPIIHQIRLPDGNWTPYAFDEEKQWCIQNGVYQDNMGCVSNSDVNSIEAQEFFLTGKKVNYSKRWIAKMSGTTKQGNYQYKVADTIRQYGMVLEEDYPTPASWTWEEFYADIPAVKMDELYRKGQEWLKKWNVQYEFLNVTDPNLDHHLKHAPIQVVIPGHAICGIYSPDQMMTVLDSYGPFIKKFSVSGLLAAKKLILTPTKIKVREIGFQGHPERGLYVGFDTMARRAFVLQKLFELLTDYEMDESKAYILPTKKPF